MTEPPFRLNAVATRLLPSALPASAGTTASIAPFSGMTPSSSSRVSFPRAAPESSPRAFPLGIRSLSPSATAPAGVPAAAGTPAADEKWTAFGSHRRPLLGVHGHGWRPQRRGADGGCGGGGSGSVDGGCDDSRGRRSGWGTRRKTTCLVAPSGAGDGRPSDFAPRVLGEEGGDRRAVNRRGHPSGGRPDYRRKAGSGAAAPAGAAPWRSGGVGRAVGGNGGGGGGGERGGGVQKPPRQQPPAAASSGLGEVPFPAGDIAPWAIGDDVAGTVLRVLSYGALVILPDGTTGLVHISEVAHRFVPDLTAEVSVGDTVTVRVTGVKGSGPGRKVALSMKRAGGPSGAYERLLVLGGNSGTPGQRRKGGAGGRALTRCWQTHQIVWRGG
ncbi:hypothetical protein MMPV_008040 [Pyropia vietnamensis]